MLPISHRSGRAYFLRFDLKSSVAICWAETLQEFEAFPLKSGKKMLKDVKSS